MYTNSIAEIVRDEGIRSGDLRIEGSRITVFDVKREVVDAGEDPHVVAGEYDLPIGDLFRALAYYYDHRDELGERERKDAAARRDSERRTRGRLERTEPDAAAGDRTG